MSYAKYIDGKRHNKEGHPEICSCFECNRIDGHSCHFEFDSDSDLGVRVIVKNKGEFTNYSLAKSSDGYLSYEVIDSCCEMFLDCMCHDINMTDVASQVRTYSGKQLYYFEAFRRLDKLTADKVGISRSSGKPSFVMSQFFVLGLLNDSVKYVPKNSNDKTDRAKTGISRVTPTQYYRLIADLKKYYKFCSSIEAGQYDWLNKFIEEFGGKRADEVPEDSRVSDTANRDSKEIGRRYLASLDRVFPA